MALLRVTIFPCSMGVAVLILSASDLCRLDSSQRESIDLFTFNDRGSWCWYISIVAAAGAEEERDISR